MVWLLPIPLPPVSSTGNTREEKIEKKERQLVEGGGEPNYTMARKPCPL
jgi:hypothetical protein